MLNRRLTGSTVIRLLGGGNFECKPSDLRFFRKGLAVVVIIIRRHVPSAGRLIFSKLSEVEIAVVSNGGALIVSVIVDRLVEPN